LRGTDQGKKRPACTITSKKQDGDNLELAAGLRDQHHEPECSFSTLKVIDDNNLKQAVSGNPGNDASKYTRCALLGH